MFIIATHGYQKLWTIMISLNTSKIEQTLVPGTMDYCSEIRNTELVIHKTMRMNLKCILLSVKISSNFSVPWQMSSDKSTKHVQVKHSCVPVSSSLSLEFSSKVSFIFWDCSPSAGWKELQNAFSLRLVKLVKRVLCLLEVFRIRLSSHGEINKCFLGKVSICLSLQFYGCTSRWLLQSVLAFLFPSSSPALCFAKPRQKEKNCLPSVCLWKFLPSEILVHSIMLLLHLSDDFKHINFL